MSNTKIFQWNDRVAVFSACLGFSTLLWLLVSLSQRYSTQMPVKVNYVNVPKDKVILGFLPEEWIVKVSAPGWNVLVYKWLNSIVEVQVSLESYADMQIISTAEFIPSIEKQLERDIKVESVIPAVINVSSEAKSLVKLPIALDLSIECAKHYELLKPATFNPDSVTLYGNEKKLSSLKQVVTESINLNNLDRDTLILVPLKNPDSLSIEMSDTVIAVVISVVRTVKKLISVPVEILDKPKNTKVVFVPPTVEIEFTCAEGVSFDSLKDGFQVGLSFQSLQNMHQKFADIQLLKKPEQVRDILIRPASVEFLIYKQ